MRLADYLAREGLTPSKLALRMNVPHTTLTRILHGQRLPGWRIMAKISEYTNGEVSLLSDYAPLAHYEAGASKNVKHVIPKGKRGAHDHNHSR